MEAEAAIDTDAMMEKISLQIDPKRARFPCCIVWTPLPVISWLVPFIGHIGICREDGVILDFAGPNFVCVDNFAFGAVARYIQMNNGKIETEKEISWDDALRMGTQEFQHRSYNLFTCNCHSFVANNLNRMFCSGCNKWNVVNLATLIFLKGRWVNKASIVRSFLPFVIVLCLGLLLGGWTFLIGLVSFAFTLVGMQWPKSPAQISSIYKRSTRLTPFPVVFCNDKTCACSTEPSPLRLSVLPISATGPATNLHCNHINQKLKGFSSSSQGVWERRASGLEACNNLGVHKIFRRYVCSPHHSP